MKYKRHHLKNDFFKVYFEYYLCISIHMTNSEKNQDSKRNVLSVKNKNIELNFWTYQQ